MTRRKNPYPGVRKNVVKGRIYWRFERGDFRTNIPGPYGSPEFLAAYEAALAGSKTTNASTALPGTLAWLIEEYLRSLRFQGLSVSRKRTIRLELDWLRKEAGKYQFERLEVRHVEALMAKKKGSTAANTVKKNMSMLFNFAAKKLGYTGSNPARYAERMKTNPDGFHTWTEEEVDRFLKRHGPGTKARLVMLLALNTGMARQDLACVGRQHIKKEGRIEYRRHKTSVAADLPILPELAEELRHVPRDRMLFVAQDNSDKPYAVASLGNWFRDRCVEANVPGSLHGLRKAGATRLADAGASEWEIASYLAHTDTTQAAVYTKRANRARLADSGSAKLRAVKMSNLSEGLDGNGRKANE
ncbi:tyrosine-type recombinase/integrase [Rhodovulum sulfidophilum]|uniref:tyrosine-type recombinase/integrase n=1 Tax=Rhodovulum sulfidophilum TaxID=35806 RepID=UPI0009515A31|nr:tyrosine-type recombinase/integrase [Rhodovulum sulfidophilum]OLS51886.1 integrase [Rhodovulum sulfidophilum]